MQSFWFLGLVILVVCGFGEAVPVDVDQLNTENDSETRLIVPPEMTSNYFELLKVKSDFDNNSTKAEKADATPMNFLRSSADKASNSSTDGLKPILAFDGSKQTPIFITIPIYITSSSEGILPIIATSIEKIAPSKIPSKEAVVKTEVKNKQELSSSTSSPSVEGNKQDKELRQF